MIDQIFKLYDASNYKKNYYLFITISFPSSGIFWSLISIKLKFVIVNMYTITINNAKLHYNFINNHYYIKICIYIIQY